MLQDAVEAKNVKRVEEYMENTKPGILCGGEAPL